MFLQKYALYIVLLFVAVNLSFASKPGTSKKSLQYEPGVVVIKLKATTAAMEKVDHAASFAHMQSKFGVTNPERVFTTSLSKKKRGEEELERIYTLKISTPTDVEALTTLLSKEPQVEFAEPNYYFPLHTVPNDPLYSQIYPLPIVKADSAWSFQKGDSTVIIGIIDSGVDWDHPDLAQAIWNNSAEIPGNSIDDDGNGYIDDVRGWDFVANVTDAYAGEDATTEDNNPMDFDGHGTHVSGIAAGATNNNEGIASLAWGCKIMPLRCGWHASDGNGYVSSLYASIAYKYAADNGASVCNQSSGTSEVVLEGARYAFKNGVVIVNSAGNSNTDFAGLLGAEPWALSVAATNSNDNKASYSSYNAKVDISAPGGDFSTGNKKGFLSTVVHPSSFFGNAQYVEFQGTSMAGPFVAALAGLVKSKNKSWSPAQVMFQITNTADNIDAKNPTYAGKLGYGRINALRAVTEAPQTSKPSLAFVSYSIDDAVGGNGNGVLEAGENAKLKVIVRNDWGDAQNLSAVLSSNHWSVSITKSNSNYGLLYGISNIDSAQRASINDDFEISLSADAIPQIIPFTVQFAADGGYTKQFNFELALSPRILIVDDDDGINNVETFYKEALNKLGTVYDVWDHTAKGTPANTILQQYQSVLWLCEWAFPSLDSLDRDAISSYLDGGGRLFISGQDVGWDLADAAGNEFVASGGSSKVFFEKYLKAKYVSDVAGVSELTGVPLDSIGNGISFFRNQPGRASTEQYPDVIDTMGGSTYSFKYNGGSYNERGGAVLYSGSFKLLYFSFGGFESIVDSTTRETVMERILKWLFEYDMMVDKKKNTEDKSNPYPINVQINSNSAIQNVDLYWDNDGGFPFKKISMAENAGIYSASIPAQPEDGVVEYFVLAKNSGGYLPYTISKFYVGPDTVKPQVLITDTIQNSILVMGPYRLIALIDDDNKVDTNSVKIHYSVNAGSEIIVTMDKVENTTYLGTIVPASTLSSGDVIHYYVTANDASVAKNQGRYPAIGTRQFIIGKEMIDDFEKIDAGTWDLGGWNYTPKIKYKGNYSLTDSPDSSYKPNIERVATLLNGYNLSVFNNAVFRFYRRNTIHISDTVFCEVSNGGSSWTTFNKITGTVFGWVKEDVPLINFVGGANNDVKIRFRFKSNDANESDGIYIDNVELLTNDLTVGVGQETSSLPSKYLLSQNYPNPFNPATTIQYEIPLQSHTVIKVYDVIGRVVATLVNEVKEAGSYKVQFNAASLSTGIYFYQITAGSFTDVKKMLIIK